VKFRRANQTVPACAEYPTAQRKTSPQQLDCARPRIVVWWAQSAVRAMQTDDFEWDDNKAASNLIKHGVLFETATFAFDDPDGLDDVEDSANYGEQRLKLTGKVDQRLLVVIYVIRGRRTRIITARKAERHEQDDYDRNRRP
jgi:uncharacterized protein